jgi:hypothetical protein
MKSGETQERENGKEQAAPDWLELVRQQVSSLKFGTVQVTVHDGRVTQVERVEKVRLDRPASVQDIPRLR